MATRYAPHGEQPWASVEGCNPWPYMSIGNYVPRWEIETVARAAVSNHKKQEEQT